MKVLYIADHHIKLGQRTIPKEWMKARFRETWDKVFRYALEHSVDYIIHGGDIFDRVPSMEELAIYGDMLEVLAPFKNIVYSGNHEATRKSSTFFEHLHSLSSCYIVLNWMNEAEVRTRFNIPNSSILPYTDLKSDCWHNDTGKILFTHVRGAIPPHVEPEIDLNLFAKWDTVYAGDLHSFTNTQRNIVYPGSPAPNSFQRSLSKNSNGILIIDTEINDWAFIDLELPQLIKKVVYDEKDIVPTTPHHTAYELVGAETSMSKVEHTDLVDKKISNVDIDQEEIVFTSLSVEDELKEYLQKKENIQDTTKYVQLFKDIT